jgi:hypothetical protein
MIVATIYIRHFILLRKPIDYQKTKSRNKENETVELKTKLKTRESAAMLKSGYRRQGRETKKTKINQLN